ncbi:hypothetical protein BGS_1140 [Beggiatoa sp. SS]|nr:hypothetical protein BGS_1140 [Beggiatoa sp. SS]
MDRHLGEGGLGSVHRDRANGIIFNMANSEIAQQMQSTPSYQTAKAACG